MAPPERRRQGSIARAKIVRVVANYIHPHFKMPHLFQFIRLYIITQHNCTDDSKKLLDSALIARVHARVNAMKQSKNLISVVFIESIATIKINPQFRMNVLWMRTWIKMSHPVRLLIERCSGKMKCFGENHRNHCSEPSKVMPHSQPKDSIL